ncbi:unnamed protein product, partial [Rotaria sp. Silwood2]
MASIRLNKPPNLMFEVSSLIIFYAQYERPLVFLVQPKVEAPKSVNDRSCVFGQDSQISWKFSGIEKPQVAWFFNGQPISTNNRFQMTETGDGTSTLSIRQAELADQGVYTARATNAVGEAEAKTTLRITCIKPVINTDLN